MMTVNARLPDKEQPLQRGALTERDKELWSMPPIASQFPVTLDNGVTWSNFVGECKGCGKPLPDTAIRGAVTRPLPNAAVLEAVGVCMDCRLLTRFLHRLYDDGRVTGPRAGKWRTWKAGTPGFFARLRALFKL